LDWRSTLNPDEVQFEISDFGFEMQDSSNFKISDSDAASMVELFKQVGIKPS